MRVKVAFVLVLVGSVLILPSVVRADGAEWIKHSGNPVLSPTPGGWDADKILQPQALYDGNGFRMWYVGRNQTFNGIGYASSPDGFVWTKRPTPVLLPGASGAWDNGLLGLGEVTFNGTDFLMWYRGTSPTYPGGAIGLATSTDGVTWVKYAANPVLAPSAVDSREITTPGVLRVTSAYYMWYSARNASDLSNGTLRILFAQSNNGMNWVKLPQVSFNPSSDPQAWDSLSLYCPSVAYDGRNFGMWYSALSQSATTTARIGYATSPDGLTWSRFAGNPILNPGPPGSWDSAGVEEPTVVTTKSGYLIYYDGYTQNMGNKIGVAQSPQGFAIPEFFSQTANLVLATLLLTTTFLLNHHTKRTRHNSLLKDMRTN